MTPKRPCAHQQPIRALHSALSGSSRRSSSSSSSGICSNCGFGCRPLCLTDRTTAPAPNSPVVQCQVYEESKPKNMNNCGICKSRPLFFIRCCCGVHCNDVYSTFLRAALCRRRPHSPFTIFSLGIAGFDLLPSVRGEFFTLFPMPGGGPRAPPRPVVRLGSRCPFGASLGSVFS